MILITCCYIVLYRGEKRPTHVDIQIKFILLLQCFVKYHLLNERTTTSCKLSKAVASLPSVKRYMSASDESFLNENQECLLRFIQLFGKFLYRAGVCILNKI